MSERASKLNMQQTSNWTRPLWSRNLRLGPSTSSWVWREISIYSCSKDVFAKALNNLDKPSVRRQLRQATNQFALLVLKYPMWTQQWPLRKLQSIDRETRKLISENGGRHPLSSTALLKQTPNQTRQFWSSTLRPRPSTSSWVWESP